METLLEPNRHDTEVDVRRQPPVEPDFLVTEVSAPLEGGVVHEPVVNRSLQLPHLVVCDEDPRDVSRDQTDGRGAWRRIRLRARQVVEKSRGLRSYHDAAARFLISFNGLLHFSAPEAGAASFSLQRDLTHIKQLSNRLLHAGDVERRPQRDEAHGGE